MKRILAVVVSAAVAGCAIPSKSISVTDVSPLQYQSYNCEQIGTEALRVQGQVQNAQLRGENAALQQAAISKKCPSAVPAAQSTGVIAVPTATADSAYGKVGIP